MDLWWSFVRGRGEDLVFFLFLNDYAWWWYCRVLSRNPIIPAHLIRFDDRVEISKFRSVANNLFRKMGGGERKIPSHENGKEEQKSRWSINWKERFSLRGEEKSIKNFPVYIYICIYIDSEGATCRVEDSGNNDGRTDANRRPRVGGGQREAKRGASATTSRSFNNLRRWRTINNAGDTVVPM